MEITEWENRLENGETPDLNDIKNLAKTSRKIYKILEKNNLIVDQHSPTSAQAKK